MKAFVKHIIYSQFTRKTVIICLAYAFMGLIAVIAINLRAFNPLTETISNFSFTDIYYSILHQNEKSEKSRIVSIVDVYQFQGRGNFANLIEDIESSHPKVVCIDVVFDGLRPDDMEGDLELMSVVNRYDNIVFSMKMEDVIEKKKGLWQSNRTIHSFFADSIDIVEAFCNMPRGNLYDSMKRKIPTKAFINSTDTIKSLIVESANKYAGYDILKDDKYDISINYSPMYFPKILPQEVYKKSKYIEDRIVYIGDLHDNNDLHWVPNGQKLAGVEILAYGTQTLLDRKQVRQIPLLFDILLMYLSTLMILYIKDWHIKHTQQSKNLFVRFIIGSLYIRNIIILLIISILVGISFFVFSKYSISLNWGWTFSGFALLNSAENMYNAIQDYLKNFYSKRIQTKK